MRSQKDEELCHEIRRVWNDNFRVYRVRKVWHQLRREGRTIARCTVERLMRQMGLKGVIGGKGSEPPGLIRNVPAHRTWCGVSSMHQSLTGSGFRISLMFPHGMALCMWPSSLMHLPRDCGWRVSSTAHSDVVLDALEQALCQRRP
ncbi:IS3 family transposase [Acetobacter orleanensis]|uniref:IS3 family transposase n=1 Tax=Acetobacter orleanensis TaxID=104099 RepID=UPI000AE3E83F